MQVSLKDLKIIYEEEIRKNVKNRKKIFKFENQKIEYLINIKYILENNLYDGGRYNVFLIYKPKLRVVMSQSIYDKVVNHYVSRFILIPKLEKFLNNRNCATRKNMGIDYAIKLLKKDIEYFKKYETFYFLKLDISKFFYKINHNILLNLNYKKSPITSTTTTRTTAMRPESPKCLLFNWLRLIKNKH